MSEIAVNRVEPQDAIDNSSVKAAGDAPSQVTHQSDTSDNVTSPYQERPKSPESCSICLGKLQNKSFTDSCFHTFCFSCLQEWSKVKAVCPLCKQAFKSIIHNVRSIEDYDQYDLRRNSEDAAVEENRFRYRTTLTSDRWMQRQRREQSRQLRMLERPTAQNAQGRWNIGGQAETSDFRRRVYSTGARVQDSPQTPGRPRRERNISPDFFQQNPACTHRLVPWLNRELNVMLYNDEDHVQFVLELIIDLIARYEIGGEVFRTHLDSFLGRRTDHFVHEFIHFARSPYDMSTYDSRAIYQVNSDGVDPATVLSVDSSSDSEINNGDSDITVLSPTEDGQRSGDHSYFSRGLHNEPPAERREITDTQRTPIPIIKRVRDFLTDAVDTAQSGWESPLPGPSTLDWSPPNPASPTSHSRDRQGSITEVSDDIHEIQSISEVTVIKQEPETSKQDNSDSETEVVITGFDKPYLERSPSPIDVSSEEDLDDLIAREKSKRTKGPDTKQKKKTEHQRSRTPAQYRIQSRSRSRSRKRSTSRSRNRSRSNSRRRSHSRSRYTKGRRDGNRSRSVERHFRYSRSSSRGYKKTSRSRSRDNHRYNLSKRSSRSRSRDSRHYNKSSSRYTGRKGRMSRSRSGSIDRNYRREVKRRRRSRSSSIEYIGWKGGRSRNGDRRDDKRGSRVDDRRNKHKRRKSSDSIEIIERLGHRRGRHGRSRERNRSRSNDRRSERDDPSYKKHPSGHKKSCNIGKSSHKEDVIPLPVPVNMIKLEPIFWEVYGPFPIIFNASKDKCTDETTVAASNTAKNDVINNSSKVSIAQDHQSDSTSGSSSDSSSDGDNQKITSTKPRANGKSSRNLTSSSKVDGRHKNSHKSSSNLVTADILRNAKNRDKTSNHKNNDGHLSSKTSSNKDRRPSANRSEHKSKDSIKDKHRSSKDSIKDKHRSSTSIKDRHRSSTSTKDKHKSSTSSKRGHNSLDATKIMHSTSRTGQILSGSTVNSHDVVATIPHSRKDGIMSTAGESTSCSKTGEISHSRSSVSSALTTNEHRKPKAVTQGDYTYSIGGAKEQLAQSCSNKNKNVPLINNSENIELQNSCNDLRVSSHSVVGLHDNGNESVNTSVASTNIDLFSGAMKGPVDLNQLEKKMRKKLTSRLKCVND